MNEIKNLSRDVLANLSIEELEQRLEMQIIALPDADWCASKGNTCGSCYGQYRSGS